MALKNSKLMWLLTAALVVAPMGSVILLLYSAGRLILRKRPETPSDPYAEWLAIRDQMRSRADAVAAGED